MVLPRKSRGIDPSYFVSIELTGRRGLSYLNFCREYGVPQKTAWQWLRNGEDYLDSDPETLDDHYLDCVEFYKAYQRGIAAFVEQTVVEISESTNMTEKRRLLEMVAPEYKEEKRPDIRVNVNASMDDIINYLKGGDLPQLSDGDIVDGDIS